MTDIARDLWRGHDLVVHEFQRATALRIAPSRNVPEGMMVLRGSLRPMSVGPLTYFRLLHGRYPFETRHALGMIEMERDRRRHGKDVRDGPDR